MLVRLGYFVRHAGWQALVLGQTLCGRFSLIAKHEVDELRCANHLCVEWSEPNEGTPRYGSPCCPGALDLGSKNRIG